MISIFTNNRIFSSCFRKRNSTLVKQNMGLARMLDHVISQNKEFWLQLKQTQAKALVVPETEPQPESELREGTPTPSPSGFDWEDVGDNAVHSVPNSPSQSVSQRSSSSHRSFSCGKKKMSSSQKRRRERRGEKRRKEERRRRASSDS